MQLVLKYKGINNRINLFAARKKVATQNVLNRKNSTEKQMKNKILYFSNKVQ
jgi:hypothetical protein